MAFITAVTYYQPERVVNNEELSEIMGGKDISQIARSLGVEKRAWAADDETTGDMAIKAARKLFAESGTKADSIDFLLFCSQRMNYFMPSTSCIIQNELGIPKTAGAFGYDLGCSGYVYGLAMASSFVDSGLAKNILLLTGEKTHAYIHPDDSNQLLFGDAASATIISNEGMAEIGKFELGTDGSGADFIIINNGSGRHRDLTGKEWTDENGKLHRDDWFFMDGEKVFNFTVECLPALINGCLAKNKLCKEDIDFYVFHQANKYMMNTLRKLNCLPKEKFFVDISDTGNTASCTVPIGLAKSIRDGNIRKGDKVMLAGFGVGLSWAGTILTFK